MSGAPYTVLIVPGLRDHVADHWQSLLAARLPRSRTVPPLGRNNLDLAARVEAIEREAVAIEGPLIIVAHSAGALMVVHWAAQTRRHVLGALLVTPPDLAWPLPDGYPAFRALEASGWIPTPRVPLPFPTIVAASRNDPLAVFADVAAMAEEWGAKLEDLGEVGHLNPASGHGSWPRAEHLIEDLATGVSQHR